MRLLTSCRSVIARTLRHEHRNEARRPGLLYVESDAINANLLTTGVNRSAGRWRNAGGLHSTGSQSDRAPRLAPLILKLARDRDRISRSEKD